ncbi:MAG: hypothetical protein M9921_08995 [Fimbriimonadaceae bacterium]|nr:hypothetical protein [Fimbriimonadaceae bacterium]
MRAGLPRQNLAALNGLADLLRKGGYWTTGRPIEADIAQTLRELFESLAWADGRLHIDECWMLDALLEEDASHGGHLREAIATQPAPEAGSFRVPGCVAAAALHDAVRQTRIRDLIINHLENLGMLFVMADSQTTHEEMEAFRAHFAKLRKIGATPIPEPAFEEERPFKRGAPLIEV